MLQVFLFVKTYLLTIFVIIKKNGMTSNKKKILIGVSVIATLGLGFWLFTYIKKSNDPNWKLIQLKKNRKVIFTRND